VSLREESLIPPAGMVYHIYPMERVPPSVYCGGMKRSEKDFRRNVLKLIKNVEKTRETAKALEGEVHSMEDEVRRTEEDIHKATEEMSKASGPRSHH
jgi:hypothetical protein